MSYWLPSTGKLFLPPPTPVTHILDTDDFVKRTDIFYHTNTDRLLTVGHPYFEIKDPVKGTMEVPKVSGSQFRVFRFIFPDPNQFTFPNPNVYNSETQRLVWAVRGLEICRGQPLGIGVTGHPFFNKLKDSENAGGYNVPSDEDRQSIAMDPKQVQLFVVGCIPCEGEHWDIADSKCHPTEKGACPAIELKNSTIQDGEMCDIGFGNMNFKNLQATKSGAPLDIVNETVKYPDFLKMSSDPFGNSMFFYAKRESMYLRHLWSRAGTVGEEVPPKNGVDPSTFYTPPNPTNRKVMAPSVYFGTPSGSLVSSDVQIFNRPFWIQRAQGTNNGVCWNNQLFLTAVDTTRGTNFTISVATKDLEPQYVYKAGDFKHYLRHVEEWEVSMIMQLCIVDLTAENLSHLNSMDPTIIENWNLGFLQPTNNIGDQYRFITSFATRCPTDDDNPKPKDKYEDMNFWKVDLTQRFSSQLENFSLGRKFLYQTGTRKGTKRSAPKTVSFESKRAPKRRRKVTASK
ncbi:L1 major capsid protein [Bos taurus papillomavirus 40]|nr:L1 major capsid protein [Bos taurus papillomavirus 40]